MWFKSKPQDKDRAKKPKSIFSMSEPKSKLTQKEKDKREYELWVMAEEYEEEE